MVADLRTWHSERQAVAERRPGMFDEHICEGVAAPIYSENGILFLYYGCNDNRIAVATEE